MVAPRASQSEIEAYARQTAAVLGLEIDEREWPSVIANLEGVFGVARVLLEDPLDDDVAAGPVFVA